MHVECPDVTVPGATVRELLEQVFSSRPKIRGYVLDDQGAVRKHVTIFINGQPLHDRHRLSDPVTEADEVFVFQALSGG